LAGSTGTFLGPRLSTTTANLGSGFGALGAAPACRQLGGYYLMHYRHVGFNAKSSFIKIYRAG
jgi:hypothetical protein